MGERNDIPADSAWQPDPTSTDMVAEVVRRIRAQAASYRDDIERYRWSWPQAHIAKVNAWAVTHDSDAALIEEALSDHVVLPRADYEAQQVQVARLKGLVQTLIDNDPNEQISDAGHSVLDHWRHDARAALFDTPPGDGQ